MVISSFDLSSPLCILTITWKFQRFKGYITDPTRASRYRGGRKSWELVKESLLVASFVITHRNWSQLNRIAENTGYSALNWLRNLDKCALNYIPEPIKHTSCLYAKTELPASFLWLAPRFDPLCIGACNARPSLIQIYIEQFKYVQSFTFSNIQGSRFKVHQ